MAARRLEIIDDFKLCPKGFMSSSENIAAICTALEGVSDGAACLMLTNDDGIRRLNSETRNVDSATDVLSFPSIEYPRERTAGMSQKRLRRLKDPARGTVFLGDICINVNRAALQAKEYGHSLRREMGYLLAHGVFHIMGYDHARTEDARKMRRMERMALRKAGLFRLRVTHEAHVYKIKRGEHNLFEELKQKAIEAMELSYSPYSKYRVGACLLSDDGQMFMGANFENASFGATICAERCCVSNAIAHGAKRFTHIAIATDEGGAWPCGICRQVLNEFKKGDMLIMTGDKNGNWQEMRLNELLPGSFGPEYINI